MASNTGGTPPQGSWTHSYEEDEGDVRVYRPTESFAFPPSRRGRETLVFGANNELVVWTLGPDDAPQQRASHWAPLPGSRIGLGGMPGAPEETFDVVEATPGVLKLRKRG